ncbi:RNA-binding protein [Dehalococcoides mccartyi CG4]|nr:RNA-binding protein [Dehalococcoides mccartyi CG4]
MNIYVGNLPPELTENELRQEFAPFGEVISVTIMNDKYIGSGQMRGYGFVEMALKSEAKAAIGNLTKKTIRGRVINVVEALPLSRRGLLHGRRVSNFGKRGRPRTCQLQEGLNGETKKKSAKGSERGQEGSRQ